MGTLGSTSSSVFIVGPGGALGSKEPPTANSENTASVAKASKLTATFALLRFVSIFLFLSKIVNSRLKNVLQYVARATAARSQSFSIPS
jgi:hypothetical protein